MYDRPETRAANDRLWSLIHEVLGYGPDHLTRDGAHHWTDPDLVLSQTCGLPYRTVLKGTVTLVGAPIHRLDCPPGTYYSVLVARRDDPRNALAEFQGAHLAANGRDSQSGWAAIGAEAREENVSFQGVTVTGAHRDSARAVASGKADLAALDVISWTLMTRWDDFAKTLKVFAKTRPAPALPYITAPGRDPEPIRNALSQAIDTLDASDRETLCLSGIAKLEPQDYFALPLHEPSCLSP